MTKMTEKQVLVAELAEVMGALGMQPFSENKIRKMALGVVRGNLEMYKAELEAQQAEDAPVAAADEPVVAEEEVAALLAAAEEAPAAPEQAAQPHTLPAEAPAPAQAEPEPSAEASEAEVAAYLNAEFARLFAANGGNEPRGVCKALRAVTKVWEGSRKEFLAAAEAMGLSRGNAAAEWQSARRK